MRQDYATATTLPGMGHVPDKSGVKSGVEKVWISCNACGADSFRELHRVGEWRIGRCSACSLIYVNPMPFFEKANYHVLSRDFYYTKLQRDITPVKLEFEKHQLRRQLERISKFSPHHVQTVKFLDLGCGPGLAVRAAAELGCEAVGIDIDSELVQLGKDQLGVDLRYGNIFECRFNENQFDLVRLRTVLQHLPNPYDVLVEVRRVLGRGGGVLITVPNEGGLLNQLNLLLGGKRKNRLGTLVLPFQSHAFTPSTLKRLLIRSGFKIHSIETTTPVDPAYASIDRADITSVNMKVAATAWWLAKAIRRGSVLVAYATAETCDMPPTKSV